MTPHAERLLEVYEQELTRAIVARPAEYALGQLGNPTDPAAYAARFTAKVRASIHAYGTIDGVAIDGSASWRATAKVLGLKCTRKAMNAYIALTPAYVEEGGRS